MFDHLGLGALGLVEVLAHIAREEKRKIWDLKMSVVYIPQSKLGVSEPPPGNLSYPLAVVLNMTSYYPQIISGTNRMIQIMHVGRIVIG